MEETYDSSLFGDAKDQQEFDALFAEGTKQAVEGRPEGTFNAKITDAALGRSANSNRMQICYQIEVTGGPHKGMLLSKYDGLGSEDQIRITMEQLRSLGIDIKKITNSAQLKAAVNSVKNSDVIVRTKQNNEFFNVYFVRPLRAKQPGTTTPAAPTNKAF